MNIKNTFGKIIFKNTLSMVKAQPKLLFFPALGTIINFLLLLTIGHPIYKYELSRSMNHVTTPVYQLTIFYIVLIFYFYFRNIINSWLMNATTNSICLLREKKSTKPLLTAFKRANHNFMRSFYWITLISCFSFWIMLFNKFLSRFKSFNDFVGNENWRMAILLAPTIIAVEAISIRAALKRSSKLLADTWGHAPLDSNFSFITLRLKYTLLTIVPVGISLFFQSPLAFYIGIAISAIYYLFLLCFIKIFFELLLFSQYYYAINKQTLPPLTEQIMKNCYYPYEE